MGADMNAQQPQPPGTPTSVLAPVDGQQPALRDQDRKTPVSSEPKAKSPTDGDTPLGPPLFGTPPQTPKDKIAPEPTPAHGPAASAPLPQIATTLDTSVLAPTYAGDRAPPQDPNITLLQLDNKVGIFFMRPYWSKQDFAFSVPAGNGTNGVVFADTRDVANDYVVAPVIKSNWTFQNFNLTFSGYEYAFSSSVNQAVNSGSGNASLTGTSSFTLREATAGEVSVSLPTCVKDCLGLQKADVGFGPCYLYLDQDYNATLTSGTNKATLHSHGNFEGIGLVTSLDLQTKQFPLGGDGWWCFFYSTITGAVLRGENDRLSDFNVTHGINPSVFDNAKDFIPVGTVEFGFEVKKERAIRVARSVDPSNPINVDAGFRFGVLAQVIGDVGMPSAQSPNSHALENGSLYLVGFGATFSLNF